MGNMKKRILLAMADGFEEIEAIAPADILRRAGYEVILAGVTGLEVTGAHDIVVKCYQMIEELDTNFDAIILPGGGLGAKNLADSWALNEKLLMIANNGAIVAAICAAPAVVLYPAGLLEGRKAVCYPGSEVNAPNFEFGEERVCVDGNIITSRGPGCAMEFGLAIVEKLSGRELATTLKERMLIK